MQEKSPCDIVNSMLRTLLLLAFLYGPFVFAAGEFSPAVESRLDQVVSVFENSDTNIHYEYIEDLGDGRGYTAGKVGFTTATGDLLLVVENYLQKRNNLELKELVPLLQRRASEHSSRTDGLEALKKIWPACAVDKEFKKTQDEIADTLYRLPARNYLSENNLHSALAYLIFYDTLVQHGDGDDPDSFNSILARAKALDGTDNEVLFLRNFLDEREKVLLNPSDPDTAGEWRESVDRVRALRRLLRHKNLNLDSSFELYVWAQIFTIN